MASIQRTLSSGLVALVAGVAVAQTPARAPRIWSDTDLADWATPIAALNLRPAHYLADEYYRIEGDNLQTYPIYDPGSEPAGYWDELQKKKPDVYERLSEPPKNSVQAPADLRARGEQVFKRGVASTATFRRRIRAAS
jgi:hypothetical protein